LIHEKQRFGFVSGTENHQQHQNSPGRGIPHPDLSHTIERRQHHQYHQYPPIIMPNFFSTQRSDERRRQRVAQCFAHQQWDELRTLLERHPELASSGGETTATGGTISTASTWTLLHSLVYHPGTPNDLIAYVAALNGGMACRQQNSTAETPLHLACDRARPDWDRIRLLLRATCPTTTTTGRHTVRRQQQRHRRQQDSDEEDDEMEDALLKRDGFGRTSFFLACANDAPFDILDDFVRRNRFVVTVRDLFAEHPLECLACRLFGNHGNGDDDTALQQTTTARLVQKLTLVAVEAWKLRPTCPRQAITKDNSREYLLLAILHVKPSLLDVILRVCCSASRGNDGGHGSTTTSPSTPTTSIGGGAPTPPAMTAGEAVAAGVWRRDAQGNLPLHVALRQPATPWHALPRLLQLAPATAQVPTGDDGQLPLHLAVRRQQQQLQQQPAPGGASATNMARTCPVPLLQPFLLAHPEALSHVVVRTGLLPYQDAAARDDDVAVIYTLLRSQPDLLPRRSRRYYSAPSPSTPTVSSSSHVKYDNKDDSADSGYPCWI
jgi:hypothetical protein